VSDAAESGRIRSIRPAKPTVDPWRPLDVLVEEERGSDGRLRASTTVFLAGTECPFTCVFCDLWQYTFDQPTPPGAIPRQLEVALESRKAPDAIKLYNASSFFDKNAVPLQDLEVVADRLAGIGEVTVECHPRLVGESCIRFAARLEGKLQVAMGLETIHPEALPRLNKQMKLQDFVSASELLHANGIGVRAFVLLSPPFVPAAEAVEWSLRTVEFALDHATEVVSVIPMRGGNGEMERLAELGLFEPPTLSMLEEVMGRTLESPRGVVLADLWDAERLSACPVCQGARLRRLRDMNRTGTVGVPVNCAQCLESKGGEV